MRGLYLLWLSTRDRLLIVDLPQPGALLRQLADARLARRELRLQGRVLLRRLVPGPRILLQRVAAQQELCDLRREERRTATKGLGTW